MNRIVLSVVSLVVLAVGQQVRANEPGNWVADQGVWYVQPQDGVVSCEQVPWQSAWQTRQAAHAWHSESVSVAAQAVSQQVRPGVGKVGQVQQVVVPEKVVCNWRRYSDQAVRPNDAQAVSQVANVRRAARIYVV